MADWILNVGTDELLHQVAKSISRHEEIFRSTIPSRCSWKKAIQAAEDSLGSTNKEVNFAVQPRTTNNRILQQLARNKAQSPFSSLNAPSSSFGLPIRTEMDISKLGTPGVASEKVRQILRKEAKSWSWPEMPPPNTLHIRAIVIERTLPVISGNLRLNGLDSATGDPDAFLGGAQLLWDTGAQSTIIVDELLPCNATTTLQLTLPILQRHNDVATHDADLSQFTPIRRSS